MYELDFCRCLAPVGLLPFSSQHLGSSVELYERLVDLEINAILVRATVTLSSLSLS